LNATLVHFLRKEATEKEVTEKEVAKEDDDDEEDHWAPPSGGSYDDGPVSPIRFLNHTLVEVFHLPRLFV
jgi:hypothetical protein